MLDFFSLCFNKIVMFTHTLKWICHLKQFFACEMFQYELFSKFVKHCITLYIKCYRQCPCYLLIYFVTPANIILKELWKDLIFLQWIIRKKDWKQNIQNVILLFVQNIIIDISYYLCNILKKESTYVLGFKQ